MARVINNDLECKTIFVLVPGLPGWGITDYSYWDTLTFDSQWVRELNAKLILVSPGPVSSHHDRACEVFAQLMGVKTDFGSEHSELYKHSRYGRDFSKSSSVNLREHWSKDKPINFICHCIGSNTIRYLQYLLSIDFWNYGTNADWIKSIISINANFNGTQFMHYFKIDPINGFAERKVLIKTAKDVLRGTQWVVNRKKELTDDQKALVSQWQLDHWGINCNGKKWINEIDSNNSFLSNKDNMFYDTTIHSCIELNKILVTNLNTFYLSFYAQATDYEKPIQISHQINPIFLKPATYILFNSCSKGLLKNPLYHTTDWRNNDGIYSVACQKYPQNAETTNKLSSMTPDEFMSLNRGNWYYANLQSIMKSKCIIDHFTMIWARNFLKPSAFQLTADIQKSFYINLITCLVNLQ